jgi:hypothetical protein
MKQYFHLIIFGLIAILIAAAVFGVYFFYGKTHTSLNQQEQIVIRQEAEQRQIAKLPELSILHQKIIDNEKFFGVLYTEEQVIDVIRDIERLAREQGVTLVINQKEALQTAAPKQDDKKEKNDLKQKVEEPKTLAETFPPGKNIRLGLRATGSYGALRSFVHKLETTPYALDIVSLDASLAPSENDTPVAPPAQSSDNPFLLGGDPAQNNDAPREQARNRVIFALDTVLYIQ